MFVQNFQPKAGAVESGADFWCTSAVCLFCFVLLMSVTYWSGTLSEEGNHLSLFRIKIMLTVTVWFLDLALKAHHHSHLLRLSPAWSPWPVTDSVFPYSVLCRHTDTLACYLCCQHTFCTFLPSLTGLESSSIFPSSTAPSCWGRHPSPVVPLCNDHDCCHHCHAPRVRYFPVTGL